MFREGKNIKDTQQDSMTDLNLTIKDSSIIISYTKSQKLITALYMVTDIIDSDEPIRNKLRTLGVEILSDINKISRATLDKTEKKIQEILSFLDIASTVNIISEMNSSILKKEFLELYQSIKESLNKAGAINRQINLSEFFMDSSSPFRGGFEERFLKNSPHPSPLLKGEGELNSKGHTRIGVQRGSTLLKALSDVGRPTGGQQDFDILKKQRRNDIISIIKTIGGNATIKDIKDRAQTPQNKSMSVMSYSEKTLQRELVSMVKDSVLNKVGEKRWSRYQLVITN